MLHSVPIVCRGFKVTAAGTFKIALLNELLENPESTSLNQPPTYFPYPPILPLVKASQNCKGQNWAKLKKPFIFLLFWCVYSITVFYFFYTVFVFSLKIIELNIKGLRVKTGSPNPIPPALVCLMHSFNHLWPHYQWYGKLCFFVILKADEIHILFLLFLFLYKEYNIQYAIQYIQYAIHTGITLSTTSPPAPPTFLELTSPMAPYYALY